jgi:hypothetical protein
MQIRAEADRVFAITFGEIFAHAPCWRASSLIQSASYPRSASNIVFGSSAPRRTEHCRLSCASPGGSVLVHPHDRGIDHLHGRIVIGSQCIHDPVPDAGPPLTDKPIIASGAGTIGHRQVASGSACAQDPKDALQDAPVVNAGNAARLVRQKRPDGSPFKVREFIPHDSRLPFGRLNHVQTDAFNRQNRTTGTSEITPP